MCLPFDENLLISRIFPDLQANLAGTDDHIASWISRRAILTTKHIYATPLNETILDLLEGKATTLFSADSTCDPNDSANSPVEYMNSLDVQGMPLHRLRLRHNAILILLRNIAPDEGLCNGTRLIFKKTRDGRVLECIIATGAPEFIGKTVLLPRLRFNADTTDYTYEWRRCQFGVKLAFVMTINKAQGQSLPLVGVYLPEPVFAHGQLYVAISRTSDPHGLLFCIKPPEQSSDIFQRTRNIVWAAALAGLSVP
jgi:ATP-dependent DNA helicase PIF1